MCKMADKQQTRVAVIVGAGPAGLTSAYEFLYQNTGVHPVIFEQTDEIGGISKTVRYNDNRIDIGGHRFFSKNKKVMDWWNRVMPLQGVPALDDLLLEKEKDFLKGGPDPEQEDRVMLLRERVSRIYYLRNFFDYPISLKMQTFTNMGLGRTVSAGLGYMYSCVRKRKEDSLENFYINRFGKPLYSMFFEDYTEKVWGTHPSQLGADWGSQRVKGLSVLAIMKDMFRKQFASSSNKNEVETSLIEEFIYPKYGPGQLWETVASDIVKKGGELHMQTTVKAIHVEKNRVVSVDVQDQNGFHNVLCDYFLSSMPIKELIPAIKGVEVPKEILKIATELPYRDFITVGLSVKKLKINNQTKIKTYQDRIPDTWIYIQERDVKIGRLQIFNNWSPYLVKDFRNTVWLGLEYFCSEGDTLWEMDKQSFIQMAIEELSRIGIIDSQDVLDSVQIKVKKAYPSYFGSYYELDKVKDFLNNISNLYCIGRNGQHRYNNMDHSMLTAMEVVDNIQANKIDKANVWSVNTEEDYHESK